MITKKTIITCILLCCFTVLSACGGAAPEPNAPAQPAQDDADHQDEAPAEQVDDAPAEDQLVTLDTVVSSEPPSLDPSIATDNTSITFIRQMFLGLTGFDENANVVPELATEWSVSDDGLTWTFNMRDDRFWYKRNDDGTFEELRPITAQDVAFGVKRLLNPETAADYAYVLYIIEGAEDYNSGNVETPDEVAVTAVDDTTVQFTLTEPAAYFPSIAAMWITFPLPQEAIDEHADKWIEPGNIVTSGPYSLQSWDHGASIYLEKNPLWHGADEVQIDVFGGPILEEASTALAMYENNEIDIMADPGWPAPGADMDRIKADPNLSEELFIAPRLCTYYYGFINTKPPFDNMLVRKAFASAIDRQSVIDFVTKGDQTPAHSFAPPGVFGNVADNMEIGAYMVEGEYADRLANAQEWIAEAGYPEGEGIDAVLMHNTSEDHAAIAQAVQAMWQEAFPQATITIQNMEWGTYLDTIDPKAPLEEKPHIYRLGWCADYPDNNNFLREVFSAKSGNNSAMFDNPEFEDYLQQAALESDPDVRKELYVKAADIMFNQEAAIAPIYYYTYVRLYKPWVNPVISPVTGDPVYKWTVDMDAKNAARGN